MSIFLRKAFVGVFIIGFLCAFSVSYAQTQNEIFEKLIGRTAHLDPEMITRVLNDEPGKKHYIDSDNDGKIDTIYMIDTDDRHQEKSKPILVKIVDEDGDMYLTGEGDLDSDLYVADWNTDGIIDAAADYRDLDSDNDVDEYYMFQWLDDKSWIPALVKNPPPRGYYVAWSKDYGDDNRLWHNTDYAYCQQTDQWLSDFNGDEMFCFLFYYDYEQDLLIPTGEIAFSFYDLDGDDYSEEALRFDGTGTVAGILRYSMDIDNDTCGSNRHDYDFSVSCFGPVNLPADKCQRVEIRGHTTEPIIRWAHMRPVAKAAKWSKAHLTWDENDNNVNPRKQPGDEEWGVYNERWEGVISDSNEYIRGIGGPSCGPFNKRNEVDLDYSGLMQFYYSPVDQRLHLFGAEVGWIKIDYNYDNTVDMIIWMEDEDEDGFFDTWKYDVDGDNLFERTFRPDNDVCPLLPFDYLTLKDIYTSHLDNIIQSNQRIIDMLKGVLKQEEKVFVLDPIESYFQSELLNYEPNFHLGEKIKNSPEGTRYYQDIIKERYWNRLSETSIAQKSYFNEIKNHYEQGNLNGAVKLLEEKILGKPAKEWFGSYKKRFAIEIANPGERYLEHHPVVLSIPEILRTIEDFNPKNYILVEEQPRIDYRIIPSQVDDVGEDSIPDELVFVYSILPSSTVKLYCYYSPTGSTTIIYPAKADTTRDEAEPLPSVGWESNWCGYRMYYGQMDFFGKRKEGLRYKTFDEKTNYHEIADWGMDVLHVNASSGIGGITIWEGDKMVPVMNPQGKGAVMIDRKILSHGPVRSLVRFRFTNIHSAKREYTVILFTSSYAENKFSKQEITITAPGVDSVVYSPGMEKLKGDQWFIDTGTGTFASWGLAGEEIGEVGLGLMFSPEQYVGYGESDLDRMIKMKIPTGKRCAHYIIGGWRKALPAPFAPTGADWAQQVKTLGLQLRTPLAMRIYQEEYRH